jgi:hypothetical protein
VGRFIVGRVVTDEKSNAPDLSIVGALVMVSGFLIGSAAFDFAWTYLFVQKMLAYMCWLL